jgi:DNA polymerase (family 10)
MDMKKIFRTAKECNCFPEINAHPERLDLNDIYAKYAKEIGLKIAINTDAHSVNELDNMRCGIFQARRGWIEKQDVINTRTLKDLRKLLKK